MFLTVENLIWKSLCVFSWGIWLETKHISSKWIQQTAHFVYYKFSWSPSLVKRISLYCFINQQGWACELLICHTRCICHISAVWSRYLWTPVQYIWLQEWICYMKAIIFQDVRWPEWLHVILLAPAPWHRKQWITHHRTVLTGSD